MRKLFVLLLILVVNCSCWAKMDGYWFEENYIKYKKWKNTNMNDISTVNKIAEIYQGLQFITQISGIISGFQFGYQWGMAQQLMDISSSGQFTKFKKLKKFKKKYPTLWKYVEMAFCIDPYITEVGQSSSPNFLAEKVIERIHDFYVMNPDYKIKQLYGNYLICFFPINGEYLTFDEVKEMWALFDEIKSSAEQKMKK